MRLRQIALVAHDLEPVAQRLHDAFGLKVAYRDPAVGVFGLVNVVMPVGGEFLEIVQPVRPDASAARYLKRRGGDAGYMLIFQTDDAKMHRERLVARGVRAVAERDGHYSFTHFHPADFGGVLVSIDSVGDGSAWRERMSDWPPAGRDWKDFPAASDVLGIAGATVQAKDPEVAAARWSDLLQVQRNGATLHLECARLRFVAPQDSDGTGIVGIDIAVRDPEQILSRAKTLGVPTRASAILNGGVEFCLRAEAASR